MSDIKPLFRWAGSKKKILSVLSQYWRSDFNRYIEPFAGSAQLFFHLQPQRAIISDVNSDLISTYKTIKQFPRQVFNLYNKLPADAKTYYKVREEVKLSLPPIEKAGYFIYLNRNCFNGIYRVNQRGEFNVPFSNNTGVRKINWSDWKISTSLLRKARFESKDFESLVRRNLRPNDFVYLDPPYALENRRIFTQYSTASFGLDDLERLKVLLTFIDESGAHFVLSYASSEEGTYLKKGWNSDEIVINRNIAGFSQNRRLEKEILITNINV